MAENEKKEAIAPSVAKAFSDRFKSSELKPDAGAVVAFVLCALVTEKDKITITEVVNSVELSRPRVIAILTSMVKARMLRRTSFLNDKKVVEYAFCKGAHPVFKIK